MHEAAFLKEKLTYKFTRKFFCRISKFYIESLYSKEFIGKTLKWYTSKFKIFACQEFTVYIFSHVKWTVYMWSLLKNFLPYVYNWIESKITSVKYYMKKILLRLTAKITRSWSAKILVNVLISVNCSSTSNGSRNLLHVLMKKEVWCFEYRLFNF